MYDYLDSRQTERLKELVPYKALAPDADEIIKELDRLNNIINQLEKDIQKEIERTNNLILEDGGLGEITTIRKMLNDERQCILFKLKKLKVGDKE